jgi:hypothetical protein
MWQVWGNRETHTDFGVEIKERDHLGDLGVDRRIILQ